MRILHTMLRVGNLDKSIDFIMARYYKFISIKKF